MFPRRTAHVLSWLPLLALALPLSAPAQTIPATARLETSGTAVKLYSYTHPGAKKAFIQVVRMDQGALLTLRHGENKSASCTNDNKSLFQPGFPRLSQTTAWNDLKGNTSKAFSIVNASLFDSGTRAGGQQGKPGSFTGLMLPFRKPSHRTDAFLPQSADKTYLFPDATWSSSQQKHLPPAFGYQRLSLYSGSPTQFATITTLNTAFTYNTGLTWFRSSGPVIQEWPTIGTAYRDILPDQNLTSAAVRPTAAEGRTLLALSRGNATEGYDAALIYTCADATPATLNTALNTLAAFNGKTTPTAWIVLDGGGSSLLTVKGTHHVPTTRLVPTFLAVVDK